MAAPGAYKHQDIFSAYKLMAALTAGGLHKDVDKMAHELGYKKLKAEQEAIIAFVHGRKNQCSTYVASLVSISVTMAIV